MSVSTQYATATASASGLAVFMFPQVPVGELWIGTVTVPDAPAAMAGTVDIGGSPVGPIFGPGIYGPYIADHSRQLSLSVDGLTPNQQYSAVWHADDRGQEYSTWPGTVTTTVEGTVVIPTPVDVNIVSPDPLPVSGTVTADQGAAGAMPWPVVPELASAAPGGSVSMTGAPVTLPSHAAVRGVTLSAPSSNGANLTVNGYTMAPGDTTPVLPVTNSNLFAATGTAPDVLSFLVT